MKIYFDGGCKPNPGEMEICIISENKNLISHEKLSHGTNNEAEWLALIAAVDYCNENNISSVEIFGDSQLIINQAQGLWKINSDVLRTYKEEYDRISKNIIIKLSYVKRANNLAGLYLEGKLK